MAYADDSQHKLIIDLIIYEKESLVTTLGEHYPTLCRGIVTRIQEELSVRFPRERPDIKGICISRGVISDELS